MSAALLTAIAGSPSLINTSLPDATAVDATATLGINNDGTYTSTSNPGGDWTTPASAAIAALWEIKVDEISNTFDAGDSTGVWLACSTSRSWSVNDPGGVATKTVDCTISWRPAGSSGPAIFTDGVSVTSVSTS